MENGHVRSERLKPLKRGARTAEEVGSGKLDAGVGGRHQTGSLPRKEEPGKVMCLVRGRNERHVENGKGSWLRSED